MNRIVLAILALFAGIAAQVSPAEARVRGETEIGSVLGQKAAARAIGAVRIAATLLPEAGSSRVEQGACRPENPQVVAVESVQLGSDRARE